AAPFAGGPGWQRRGLTALDGLRPLAGSAVRPVRDAGGVWNVPQTYLFAPATAGRRLPVALWCRRPLSRLRQAARHRSLFHLWFHPYNVTADPERALAALEVVCRAADRLRAAGRGDGGRGHRGRGPRSGRHLEVGDPGVPGRAALALLVLRAQGDRAVDVVAHDDVDLLGQPPGEPELVAVVGAVGELVALRV